MPSGYGASSDNLSRRCRPATIGLADLTVNCGGSFALYRSGASLSASTRFGALARSSSGHGEVD